MDIQIIIFLHACNYNKEYTKKIIREYFTLRATKCAITFRGRDPFYKHNLKQLDVIHMHLIKDENDGFNYFWTSLKIKDASKYYPSTAVKLMHMAIELEQIENGTAPGYRVIIDSTDVGFSHAMRFSINNVRNMMIYIQNAIPFVIDKIYVINVTPGIEKIYTLAKPFMHKSLIDKVIMKSVFKTKEFLKSLPQHILSKDYGGLGQSMNELTENAKNKLNENREYFIAEELFRNGILYNDEVETNLPIENESVPTFKNLCID
ncbi:uncharacterized protein LOC126900654 isoform X2 [Daktulosphaira vitifoliae]|nr:uncharacterized protein LOC126900654 isoform X2 [Daktulosphaira vitifoliae]XP_050532489.1 uncharacterized protein LOC126900654 isoform X2 [Daktulosphaira vitifoliae]